MFIRFSRVVIVKVIACAVSTVVIDFLLNKKMWCGIKNKFVDFKDYTKQVVAEGALAYRKGRESSAQYRRDKALPLKELGRPIPMDKTPALEEGSIAMDETK